MVTHRGTGQNDVTVHLAAEPAGLPGSQTTLWSFSFTEATTPPKLTKQKQRLGAMTAPHARLRSKQSGLTIPSSAASEASPLQRVVRPIFARPPTLLDELCQGTERLGGGPKSFDLAHRRAE